MNLKSSIWLFAWAFEFVICQKSGANLKRDIFQNYNSQSMPVSNTSNIMNICVGLYVLQIVGLSEKLQV